MVKPFDFEMILNRIRELSGASTLTGQKSVASSAKNTERNLEERITNIFLTIGIPAHIKGYHFCGKPLKWLYRTMILSTA